MIYFNINVIEVDGKFKAQIPNESILIVAGEFYDLQQRMYDHLDRFNGKLDYRLLFLIKPTKYEQTSIGDTNTNNSGS